MLIVTGFDGSPSSQVALLKADELASCLNAEHHVVMVAHVAPIEYTAMANPYQVDLHALEKDRLESAFAGIRDRLATEAKPVLMRGNPAIELTAYVEEHGGDMLVVGSRGRGAVATMLLGSTSHGVLWRANSDVLVVNS